MKKQMLIFGLGLGIAAAAGAVDKNQDSESHTGKSLLSVAELRERLAIRGEVFVLDATAKHLLYQSGESRSWESSGKDKRIVSQWGTGSDEFNEIQLKNVWEVQSDGAIKMSLEQYAKTTEVNGERKFSDLLGKKDFTIENFAPVIWRSLADKDKVVVVRFTPYLKDEAKAQELSALPISGTQVLVVDSNGRVWTDHLNISGAYISITTVRGTLGLSYKPFAGAKEMGTAQGHRIVIDLGSSGTVNLVSETAFVPAGLVAKVYGISRPDLKTARLNSTKTGSSNDEQSLLEHLK